MQQTLRNISYELSELLRVDLSFIAAMHMTSTKKDAPRKLPLDSSFYGVLRHESHGWPSPRSIAARKYRKRSVPSRIHSTRDGVGRRAAR